MDYALRVDPIYPVGSWYRIWSCTGYDREPDYDNRARWRRAMYKLLQQIKPSLVAELQVSNDTWQRVETMPLDGQLELCEEAPNLNRAYVYWPEYVSLRSVRWLHEDEPQAHLVDQLLFNYPSMVFRKRVLIKDRWRTIWISNSQLKLVLRAVKRRVLSGFVLPAVMHGYIRRRSILTCARVHQSSQYLLSLDLSDAFETGLGYKAMGWLDRWHPSQVSGTSEVLRALILPNGTFPRGFCTSPTLFNLAMLDLALELTSWCERHGWRLSIYSDNIFLSRDSMAGLDIDQTIRTVQRIITNHGWEVNDHKTRFTDLQRTGSLQLLGLVLKNGEVAMSHGRLRELRRQLWLIADRMRQNLAAEERESALRRYRGLMTLPDQVYGFNLPALLEPPLDRIHQLL